MPVGIGGILPSNFRYYYIKRPDWYKPKVCVRILIILNNLIIFISSGENKRTANQ